MKRSSVYGLTCFRVDILVFKNIIPMQRCLGSISPLGAVFRCWSNSTLQSHVLATSAHLLVQASPPLDFGRPAIAFML